MPQRRQKASSKLRSRSPRQAVNSPRLAVKRERQQRKEALERERATSEILRAIAESQTDAQPVFDTIVRNAVKLCGGKFANAYRYDGEQLHIVASTHKSVELQKILADFYPARPNERQAAGRAILAKATVKIEDALADPAYDHRFATTGSWRRVLAVPMLRRGEPIGVIAVVWAKPGPVSTRQEQLLKTFADQAVIAIENVRLFNETKEALERQTATSNILGVISSSPTDLAPVFDAILGNATALCDAHLGVLNLYDGEELWTVAHRGTNPEFEKWVFERGRFKPEAFLTGLAAERGPVHIADIRNTPAYREGKLNAVKMADLAGARTFLAVPLLKESRVIGAISIYRPEVRLFTDKQIALVGTFANQAVIAIENVRLFNETKEALEQQTATGEILSVIARSPTNVQPVFDSIAQSCVQLFGGMNVTVTLARGQRIELAAFATKEGLRAREQYDQLFPLPLNNESVSGRAILSGEVVYVADPQADDSLGERTKAFARAIGYHNVLCAPMIRDGKGIGTINVMRGTTDCAPYTEKQIALFRAFANQAVIAIENVRLFNETKEALERQTATSEILRVISSSPTDVQPVFDAIARSAVTLCGGMFGAVFRYDGEYAHFAAHYGFSAEALALMQRRYPRIPEGLIAPTLLDRAVSHSPDVLTDPRSANVELHRTLGSRSFLSVPMLLDARPIGAISVFRRDPGPFTDAQIALLQTFADQAVIAIENVRLFKELQARTEALTKSVGQLTALGEVGQAISSTLDLETVLKTIVSRAVQLAALDAGWIYEFDERDERFHLRAALHVEEEILQVSRSPLRLGEGAVGRAGATREPVVVEDVLDESYQSRVRELLIKSGSRAVLAVPLLREDLLLGALAVSRKAPGPFAPEVIELLKTFATQSAVAIQNARLFNETKQALEQQKATAEVLGVISGSIADTQPVFEKILDSCERLFEGHLVGITVVRPDGMIDRAAYRGPHEEEIRSMFPMPLSRDSASGNAILDAKVVHYPDIEAPGVPAGAVQRFRMAGTRAIICAPMLFEGQGVGAIWVGRNFAAAFTDKHIALLRTFADQAAIAIQNAKLFREIQEKSAQLEVASQHKSQFLASMSHELRTPLNAILGFNEMMLDGLCGEVPAGFKDPLDEMQKSGKHLLRLINNVLDLAKIEAGRMELALGDYSVHDTVESVRSTLRPLAAEKGLEFLANVPADIPLAYGDAGRITQCLMNLAGNSLKFTKEGRVEISVQQQNGQLRYCVADTGIGIPLEKIGSLFTEFKQTDPTIASEYGGTGLGLSITKRFIEMHGGRIWVESEIGKGSAFTFEIPLKLGE